MESNQSERVIETHTKPDLNRANSTSPQLLEIRKNNNNKTKKLIIFLTFSLTSLLFLTTSTSSYSTSIYSKCHYYYTTTFTTSTLDSTELENVESNLSLLSLEKRKEKDNEQPAEFSTSTYEDGKITTFMFTTAPIVNPGGYTIGTYTGYRPLKTTTITPSPSPSPTPTLATLTIDSPPPSSPTPPPTMPPTVEELNLLYTVIGQQLMDGGSKIVSGGGQGRIEERSGIEKREFVEEESSSSSSEVKEYSTSTGEEATVTLVKTTRAIVNPGGYTIGFISGVYVPVPTSMPTSTSTSTSSPISSTSASIETSSSGSSSSKIEKRHEELRRRNEEES